MGCPKETSNIPSGEWGKIQLTSKEEHLKRKSKDNEENCSKKKSIQVQGERVPSGVAAAPNLKKGLFPYGKAGIKVKAQNRKSRS